jgi:adenylate cyclase
MFWPEHSDRAALGNLRYSLANLRRTLGDRTAAVPFLLITHDSIQLNQASDIWLDVTHFPKQVAASYRQGSDLLSSQPGAATLAAAAVQNLQAAIALYRGCFLEGFSAGDSAPFEEWMLLRREQIEQQVISALSSLVTEMETRGNYQDAQAYVRQQMALEPWNEAAQRSLMRILASDGQRTAALHQFQICRRVLWEELGVEPAEETVALYEAIRVGKWGDRETSRQVDKGGIRKPASRPSLSLGLPVTASAPIVAREEELARLDALLAQAVAGAGGVVFVAGEAGSGKTALLGEFTRRAMMAHAELLVARGACDAVTGIGDPYLPFREILQLLTGDIEPERAGAGLAPEHTNRLWLALPDAVQALAAEGRNLIDTLVPAAGLALRVETFARQSGRSAWLAPPPLPASQGSRTVGRSLQASDVFEQVTRVVQSLARRHPLVLVLDDLQWADTGSISLLFHLGMRLAASRILLVGAFRPDAVAPPTERERHPLDLVVQELLRFSGQALIDLDACAGRPFVEALLDSEPNRLGAAFREQLYRHTEGHPLFTVELLRSMESRGGLLRDAEGRWVEGPALHWDSLPTRVDAAIAEHIGRLPAQCRTLLAAASVEGEEFIAESVARATGMDQRAVIQCLSNNLAGRHRLVAAIGVQRFGARKLSAYRFRHHLFQTYLYDHLDPVQRAQMHEAAGNALEALYVDAPDDLDGFLPRLAWHFEQAGLADRSAVYHLQAGNRAARVSAYDEAIAHYSHGSALLEHLPDSPARKRLKLELQLANVSPLMIARGFWASERLHALEAAYEIAQHPVFDDSPERWLAQATVANIAFWAAEPEHCLQLSQDLLILAERSQDQQQLMLAHHLTGAAWWLVGDLARARAHLEQALVVYDRRGHNPSDLVLGIHAGIANMAWLSFLLWLQGYPDQSRQMLQRALAAAENSGHGTTLDFARVMVGMAHSLLGRDSETTWRQVESLWSLTLPTSSLTAWIDNLAGWALVEKGENQSGLQQILKGIATAEAVGGNIGYAMQRMYLARSYAQAGQGEAGLVAADEALAWMDTNNVRLMEAEAYRLKGELLLIDPASQVDGGRLGRQAAAETLFRQAIELARRQGARWWELRAAASLCRLLGEACAWRDAPGAEARQMLAEIYGWVSEGFDTVDLREAREMLEVMGAGEYHNG